MKKLFFAKFIKYFLIAFTIFSFVSCGGGGGGGSSDYYEPSPTPSIEAEDGSGSIQFTPPSYSGLPVSFSYNGNANKGSTVTFTVKDTYDSYEWTLDGAELQGEDNGKSCTFKLMESGQRNLFVCVTKGDTEGSLSVYFTVSE